VEVLVATVPVVPSTDEKTFEQLLSVLACP